MLKSIKYKIWLTFLVTLAICMSAMLMLTQISMRAGFLNYVSQQTVHKLEYIAEELLDIYRANGGTLESLYNNPEKWVQLRHHAYKNIDLNAAPDASSPPHLHQYNFVANLLLTDENKQAISGHFLQNAHYHYYEVRTEQNVLAHIAYVKPADFVQSIDHHFLHQQLRSLAAISVGVALASLAVVLLLSRWLITPLTALSRSAKQIASGEFDVRIEHKSNDELGDLCRNFNELANTLSANEKSRKQWVADISHEMRTPLAVVKAQIEAMQDGIRETNQDNLGILKDKIDSLNLLINDLYELSLSDLGALSYNKEKIDFSELIEQINEDFFLRAKQSGIELKIDNQLSQSTCIFGDTSRLMQLLINLVQNAINYTDAPGQILIKVCSKQDNIIFTIDDSKPGVNEDKREKIFERLFRVESSRNRDTGGSGLGLSICKNITEAHEGHIIALASSLGGLQIKVELPMVKS